MSMSTFFLQGSWSFGQKFVVRIKHVVGYFFPSSSFSFTLDVVVVILMISSVQDRVRPVSGRVERSSRQLRVHGTSPDGVIGGRPIWKVCAVLCWAIIRS